MKAIIHIGMPKTGTKSIQTWMRANRAALENAGARLITEKPAPLLLACIHVAMTEFGIDEKAAWRGVEGRPVARRLGLEIDWNASRRAIAEQRRGRAKKIKEACEFMTSEFDKLSGEAGAFVWSDERYFNKSNLISSLDKILGRHFDDRTYVVYIRDTVDHLVSSYTDRLRRCDEDYGTMKFSEFLEKCAEDPYPFGKNSSLENLFVWQSLLGDKLCVRLLETDWLNNGDLIEDFSSIVGVGSLYKPGRMNESFAAEHVDYVRFLNRSFGLSLPDETRKRVLAILKLESSGKPKLAASDAQAFSILKVHRELEEKVRARFFPERPLLFSKKSRGGGIMPSPLTKRRKAEIETEINDKLGRTDWKPNAPECGDCNG